MQPLRIREAVIGLLAAGGTFAIGAIASISATDGTFTNVSATTVTSSAFGSAATSTFTVNNRSSVLFTGSSATATVNFASLDTCLVMKGQGATTYVRINNTGSLVTSTSPCPTSP